MRSLRKMERSMGPTEEDSSNMAHNGRPSY